MAVMDHHTLCINTILSIPCCREAPVKVYHGEGWRNFVSITLQWIHVLRMLQPLRHLPHSQWTYYCSYTISISLRGFQCRFWCWSSPELCAQHTAMLWGKDPLNWPHNLYNPQGLYCPPLIPAGIRGFWEFWQNQIWQRDQPNWEFHSGGILTGICIFPECRQEWQERNHAGIDQNGIRYWLDY